MKDELMIPEFNMRMLAQKLAAKVTLAEESN